MKVILGNAADVVFERCSCYFAFGALTETILTVLELLILSASGCLNEYYGFLLCSCLQLSSSLSNCFPND